MRKLKLIKLTTIGIFLILQVTLLYTIVKQHEVSWFLYMGIAFVTVLVLLAYAKLPLHHPEHLFEDIQVAIWVPVGAVSTYILNIHLELGPVLAASIIGVLASFIPEFYKKSVYLKQLPVALYCGAFVGMCGSNVAHSFWFVLIAGLVTAVFLVVSKSLFNGIGGKLGTLAFGGVALTSFLYFLLA